MVMNKYIEEGFNSELIKIAQYYGQQPESPSILKWTALGSAVGGGITLAGIAKEMAEQGKRIPPMLKRGLIAGGVTGAAIGTALKLSQMGRTYE